MDRDLLKLILLIEIKGNFHLEKRNSGFRPIFQIMSIREGNLYSLVKTLKDYNIKHHIYQRKYKKSNSHPTLLKVSGKKNLQQLFNLIEKDIEHKPKNYEIVKKYSFKTKVL